MLYEDGALLAGLLHSKRCLLNLSSPHRNPESTLRSSARLRLGRQLSVVRQVDASPLPQQDRPLQGEATESILSSRPTLFYDSLASLCSLG